MSETKHEIEKTTALGRIAEVLGDLADAGEERPERVLVAPDVWEEILASVPLPPGTKADEIACQSADGLMTIPIVREPSLPPGKTFPLPRRPCVEILMPPGLLPGTPRHE